MMENIKNEVLLQEEEIILRPTFWKIFKRELLRILFFYEKSARDYPLFTVSITSGLFLSIGDLLL